MPYALYFLLLLFSKVFFFSFQTLNIQYLLIILEFNAAT